MQLLDRYLLRELLIPLAYCLFGFLIFWIAFDLFAELDDYQLRGLNAAEIARLYLIKTPELLVIVLPIALLLGLLYALTNHARHQELTAVRAAGISLWRLSAPYFGVGLVFTIALYALNELWVPKSVEAVESMLHRQPQPLSAGDSGRWHPNLHFHNSREGRFWSLGAFNLDTFELKNPHVSWLASDQTKRSLNAQRAVRTNGCWVFYGVEEFTYRASGDVDTTPVKTNRLAVPEFTETPEQIKSEIKINRLRSMTAPKGAQLSIAEILNYLRLHPHLTGNDHALLQTQLHGRLAWPWTCLVVVVIALPFGAVSARRNLFVGVASSIFLCFAFFVLQRLGVALGSGAWMTPWIAAWLPNLAFGGAGLWLTARVR